MLVVLIAYVSWFRVCYFSSSLAQCDMDHVGTEKNETVVALYLSISLPLGRTSATSCKFQYTVISLSLFSKKSIIVFIFSLF